MEHSPSLQTETRTAGHQIPRLSLPNPQRHSELRYSLSPLLPLLHVVIVPSTPNSHNQLLASRFPYCQCLYLYPWPNMFHVPPTSQLITAEVWFRGQSSSCGICGA